MDLSRRKTAAIFLLLMIPGYIIFVYALPSSLSFGCGDNPEQNPRVTDQVGFCDQVSATVTREYYLGMLRLPVYRLGISFDLLNRYFLPVLLVSAVVLWREYI